MRNKLIIFFEILSVILYIFWRFIRFSLRNMKHYVKILRYKVCLYAIYRDGMIFWNYRSWDELREKKKMEWLEKRNNAFPIL